MEILQEQPGFFTGRNIGVDRHRLQGSSVYTGYWGISALIKILVYSTVNRTETWSHLAQVKGQTECWR